MNRGAIPGAPSTCIDEIEDDGCRYITERDGQVRVFLDPGVSSRSELPNRVDHRRVDPESPENVQLIIVEGHEATRQSYPVSIPRPGRRNCFNCIGNGVVAENPISSGGLSSCRAAYTVDVRRARIVKNTASHVADLVIGIGR